jgi:hypothetical protein
LALAPNGGKIAPMGYTPLLVPLLLGSLAAQQVLHQGFGPAQNARTGEFLAAGGDLDGDQRPDLVVGNPGLAPATLSIVSGANGSVRTLLQSGGQQRFVAGDLNLDGAGDLLIRSSGALVAISGSTLTPLWQLSSQFLAVAPTDDRNGDGRSDVLAITMFATEVRVLSGLDGSTLSQLVLNNPAAATMLPLGDVTGDGVPEVAFGDGSVVRVASLSSGLFSLWLLNEPGGNLAAADLTGDGRNELLVGANGAVKVLSASTGALLRTFPGVDGARFAVLGDLNADGVPDLALRRQVVPNGTAGGCEIVSGATGDVLAVFAASPQLRCEQLVGLGDADGDGFGDFAIGDPAASVAGPLGNPTGGWQIVSGKILAFREAKATNCAPGPILPAIAMTLPRLGQVATVSGSDAPAGAVGLVAFGAQPANPVNLGVAGCDVWFDPASGFVLQATTTATWQFGLALPPQPQLAGVTFALQAVYLPSATALGLALTNGIWGRAGF